MPPRGRATPNSAAIVRSGKQVVAVAVLSSCIAIIAGATFSNSGVKQPRADMCCWELISYNHASEILHNLA
jgi:hypothetical protein